MADFGKTSTVLWCCVVVFFCDLMGWIHIVSIVLSQILQQRRSIIPLPAFDCSLHCVTTTINTQINNIFSSRAARILISSPIPPLHHFTLRSEAAPTVLWATWHLASCSTLLWSQLDLWGQKNLLILCANLEPIRQTASLSLQGAKVASLGEVQRLVCSFHNLWLHTHARLSIFVRTSLHFLFFCTA